MHPLIPYFPIVKIPIAGDFAIHGFGILVALGFVFGAQMAMRKARRDGLDPDVINRVVTWIVVGVFVGGHLGHLLFYYPQDLIDDPMEIFRMWRGLSSFGGFLGSAILGYLFFRREDKRVLAENRKRREAGEPLLRRVRFLPYADTLAYSFSIGWFFGRMGCFSAHDHPGTQTNFWLGVYGMCSPQGHDLGIACHDLGLYEALFSLVLFFAFLWLDRKPRYPGFFLATLMVAYAPVRFAMDFLRTDDPRHFGLTAAQIGSVVLLGLGLWIIKTQRGKPSVRPVAQPGEAQG